MSRSIHTAERTIPTRRENAQEPRMEHAHHGNTRHCKGEVDSRHPGGETLMSDIAVGKAAVKPIKVPRKPVAEVPKAT
ncbi:MAG: hypothetical protein IKO55_05015 [Kiritimatiellae bacterium]|nr:hypothetical protein [Kiritimatiellia bacterium]